MPNKQTSLTVRWMEEVWNKGREDAIDEMMDANAVVHGLEGVTEPGPEAFKAFFRNFKQQFPTINVQVDDVVSEPGFETARCTVDGTDANGNNVHFTGITFLQIGNGKILEAWNNFDFMNMYAQLGFKMVSPEQMTA